MRIGNDISIFAGNQLSRTTSAIARSLQRLSSGLRVNSPQDDVAAFSEGVKLDSQIRGYTQAARNINDAAGLVQTASSAIDTQIDIVQKMREIAVQASNGTLTSADRANLNIQIQSLYQEFARITSTTQFNGINLLDGSFGTHALQIGPNQANSYGIQMPSLQGSTVFQKTVGTGTFQTSTAFNGPGDVGIAIADLNGDGIQDLVFGDGSGMMTTYLGKGDGSFTKSSTVSSPNTADFPSTADFNGDGILDVVVADFTFSTVLAVFMGNGDGTFKAATTINTPAEERSMTADFNHDGKMDILLETTNGYQVLLGNGNGTFAVSSSASSGFSAPGGSLDIGDVNRDGNMDFMIGSAAAGIASVVLGNGDGTFKTRMTFSVAALGSGITETKFGDFNRDGKLDVASTAGNAITVALGNGDGTFLSPSTIYTDTFQYGLAITDVNGDGVLDLASTDQTSKKMAVLLGNGDGTFALRKTFVNSDGIAASSIAFGDFNRDGVADVVTVSTNLNISLGNSTQVSAVTNLNVTSVSDAQTLISILDSAISNLKSDQASLGAIHSRLNQSSSFGLLMSQNLSEAKSNALDVDIALETSELVRKQILQQAQVAVLGQANISSQMVLSLLKNLSSH